MGLSYFYANRDKRQFLNCGLVYGGDRFSQLGSGPGARALAILLSERGSWRNDRIAAVSDTSEEWNEIVCNWLDIEIEAVLMLIDIDGLGWLEKELDEPLGRWFAIMYQFATYLRRPDVIKLLNKKFGVGKWERRYASYLKHNTDIWSQKVIEADNRRLRIWNLA